MNVEAKLVDEFPRQPGEFIYRPNREQPTRILFCCPCGCGDILAVALAQEGERQHPIWTWDGNREKPTVSPSIEYLGGCRYHGWLKQGVFSSC